MKLYKLRRYFVYKLGGIMVDDLPDTLQCNLYRMWANKTMDKAIAEVIKNSF